MDSSLIDLVFCKLLLDGLLAGLAIRDVEAEVRPVLGGSRAGAVGDGDGVSHAEVHGLHDTLPLQLPRGADGHGGGVAAGGADQLLAPVVVTLFQVLEPSPDNQAELLWDLQSHEVLREAKGQKQNK